MKKICRYCGKEIEKPNNQRVFCSKECSILGGKIRRRKWERDNRERCNKLHKAWNKRNPEKMKAKTLSREVKDVVHQKVRRATRYKYGKPEKCDKCGSTKIVQYHHEKPYHKDKFIVLCRKHHLEAHGIFNSNSFGYREDLPSSCKGEKNNG